MFDQSEHSLENKNEEIGKNIAFLMHSFCKLKLWIGFPTIDYARFLPCCKFDIQV